MESLSFFCRETWALILCTTKAITAAQAIRVVQMTIKHKMRIVRLFDPVSSCWDGCPLGKFPERER